MHVFSKARMFWRQTLREKRRDEGVQSSKSAAIVQHCKEHFKADGNRMGLKTRAWV